MSGAFRVIVLPQRQDQDQDQEVMGSKPKFWLRNRRTGRRCLWKEARAGSGEDWSEKVAHRIAVRLGVPCPRIDLARLGDKHGVLSWDFLWERTATGAVTRGSLIHGNDLLWQQDSSYPKSGVYRVKQHTVAAVNNVLRNHRRAKLDSVTNPQGNAFDSFIGYLLLDALIGNTDRHHENWGVESVRTSSVTILRLAPSYDHASSLGRELSDDKRDGRMSTRGRGTVADYADKAKSAFWDESGSRVLSPLVALQAAAALGYGAFCAWQAQLKAVKLGEINAFVERVPQERLSALGKKFACELLAHNYQRVVDLKL